MRPVVRETSTSFPFAKAAVAAVIVVAIGAGAYWVRDHDMRLTARGASTSAVIEREALEQVADRSDRTPRKTRSASARVAVADRNGAALSPKSAATNPPKTAASSQPPRATAAVAKPVRAQAAVPEVPAAHVPNPESPAPPIEPSAPVLFAAVPSVATPPPASGPFFETKDVNESPRVTARVEPRLPSELRARAPKEIVIVRALVSETGYPSRISLLRRSKTGQQVDEVVVAAVNQWTFAPARKKGEAVSCWFNFGVEVGRAE